MSSLFGALRSTADALSAFERGLTTSQNNVANASTPGYARQIQGYSSRSFDPTIPTTGGVRAEALIDTRNEYLEGAVRRHTQDYNRWNQLAASLEPLQDAFTISETGGIGNALDDLYTAFSAWSATPNDTTARQAVLQKAATLATSFHAAENQLTTASADADGQMKSMVDRINTLSQRVADLNARRNGTEMDPGLSANLHSTLEELSEIADVQAYRQSDGSWTVLLGGDTPLVVGTHQYDISFSTGVPTDPTPTYADAAPNAMVYDSSGRDITAKIDSGKLGGLLDLRNRVLANLRGDSTQAGELNRLAKAVAGQVNDLLTAGLVSEGPPEVTGVALFTFSDSDSATARTLQVNPDITASQLAAIQTGPPAVSNGTALALAKLSSTGSIDGGTFSAFYAGLAATVGSELATARDNTTIEEDSLTQAQDLRQQASGVSLDQEAIKVLEFQKAYQAASKLVSVLSELTDTVINMVR